MEKLMNTLSELQWSYAALWTLSPDRRVLKWQEGWYNPKAAGTCEGRESDNKNAELFYFLYNQLTFGPGVGFAGHALDNVGDRMLWLAGDEALASIPNPVENQTHFMKAAGIQTTVCITLADKVLELGTTNMVPENDEYAHCIKKILYTLLDPYLMKPEPCHFPDHTGHSPFGNLDMGALTPILSSATSAAAGSSSVVPALPNDFSCLSSKPLSHSNMTMVDHLPSVYNDLDRSYMLAGAAELIPNGLSWTTSEHLQPLQHLLQNDLDIWSCTTPALAAAVLQGPHEGGGMGISASSETTMVDHIDQGLPGFNLPFIDQHVSNFLGIANGAGAGFSSPSPQNYNVAENGAAATTSLRDRSSSRSSLGSAAAAQHLEDNEISSVAKVYGDCQISEGKNGFMTGDNDNGSSWIGRAPPPKSSRLRRSQSPNERSPDSLCSALPKARVAPSNNQCLQLQGVGLTFHPGSSSVEPSQQHKTSRRLERQQSSSSTKPVLDSTPVLLQVGNVLQLGNASGEVAEALPQENDEAAVSHMLAERRRRIKQNENFTQLKALIPTAAKMDKASILAETIVYINNLKTRLETLEQCNESLKILLADRAGDLLVSTSANGGSPAVTRVPSPPRPSSRKPVDVSYDGEGNLRIEIRASSAQPESAIHLLTTLKQMQLKVLSSQMSLDDDRITATFVVKMKRKNSTVQNEVCANVTSELRRCLGL
ncbi:hypothetical protein R1flu_009902 [Riccia fluitans]|uniref:BHLH domain-containing protein n=1 Tax=Riccia fluitans TaxID=41844 RepID=A0ABD1Z3G2_9MARC